MRGVIFAPVLSTGNWCDMARFDMTGIESMEIAAQCGAIDALFELGMMYSTGRDAPLDYVTAHKYFNLAAMNGNEEAKIYRVELAYDMEREDVREAQRLAREWLQAA